MSKGIGSIARNMAAGGVMVMQAIFPFFAATAYAQTFNIQKPQDIGTQIICPVAVAMFWVLIAVSTVMVLYAAFLFLVGRGEEDTISKARKTILYAAIAIAVALIARGFPSVVAGVLGQSNINGCS